jgi:ParB/RepB/Spo0J family partition protein
MIESLSLSLIEPSPSNPRRTVPPEYLEDLAASIRDKGVLSPILVRPKPHEPGFHELVFGECRWRAAKLAGLTEIPAMVRELDDRQVLEIQIIENDKRQDVHPVEQAEAYRRLIDEHGYTAEDLAAKTGRSLVYVRQRLALGDLGKIGRVALDQGKITLAVALLVARLPPAQQTKAIEELIPEEEDPGVHVRDVATLRQAREIIAHRVAKRLADAPFDLADETISPRACIGCPKRTSTQAELFDLGADDLCTDVACFAAKVDVHWSRLVERGAPVLPPSKVEEVFGKQDAYVRYDAEFVAASSRPWWSDQALGEIAPDLVVQARAPNGEIVQLLPKKVLKDLERQRRDKTDEGKEKIEDDFKRQAAERRASEAAVAEACAKACAKVSLSGRALELAFGAFRALAWSVAYQLEPVAKRHGLQLLQLEEAEFTPALLAECVTMALSRHSFVLDEWCKSLRVDRASIEKEAKKALKAPKAKKAAPKKKAEPKKKTKTRGTPVRRQMSIPGA